MSKRTEEEIIELSGNVTDARPLVRFLYLLGRDHLPMGVIEKLATATLRDSPAGQ